MERTILQVAGTTRATAQECHVHEDGLSVTVLLITFLLSLILPAKPRSILSATTYYTTPVFFFLTVWLSLPQHHLPAYNQMPMPASLNPARIAELRRYHAMQRSSFTPRSDINRPHLQSDDAQAAPSELYAMIVALIILVMILFSIIGTLIIHCAETHRLNSKRTIKSSKKDVEESPESLYVNQFQTMCNVSTNHHR